MTLNVDAYGFGGSLEYLFLDGAYVGKPRKHKKEHEQKHEDDAYASKDPNACFL